MRTEPGTKNHGIQFGLDLLDTRSPGNLRGAGTEAVLPGADLPRVDQGA